MKKKPNLNFVCQMSWERPVEEQLLEFVRNMASNMESVSEHNRETGWFANNTLSNEASKMALAYRTVEKRILEIKNLTPSPKG